MQTHGGQAAEDAITGRERHFSHRLMVDWDGDGTWDHPLSDMSEYAGQTSRDQATTSTAPEELRLFEGYAAAAFDVTANGEYNGLPLSGHFAPYNAASVFYQNGLPLGVDMYYEVGVWTALGWVWYRQFTGIVREVTADRATGDVVLRCLDNAEKMRTPLTIPPYAAYQDYLVNGYKRSGLVDSSSVIDLAARAAGFDNSPRGYWVQNKTFPSGDTWGKKYVLSVPFHGSMLPEIGALDNEFEFHLTEAWENGTAAEQARAEQYRDGPDFAGNGKPYLACNAVPRGANSWITKKYWAETHDYLHGNAAWGTTVLGTWIYWTGSGVDEDSTVLKIEFWDASIELNVRSSDRGVYPILRTGKRDPNGAATASFTGPLLTLPTAAGWNYVEVAVNIETDVDALMQTRVNSTVSAATTAAYRLAGSSEYALGGLVTIENKYALSDLFVFRNRYRQFITNSDAYDFTSPANVNADWGRNRFIYTLRDDSKESWDVVKEVSSAEYGVTFFDEHGEFTFWNYDTVESKQQAAPVRTLTLDEVSNLSLRVTMDSVRNVWVVTTKTAEAVPSVSYDLAKNGVPRQESDTSLPAVFNVPPDTYSSFMIPDHDHVISTHPFLTLLVEAVQFDEYAPWEGYKTYQGGTYVGYEMAAWPRKSGPYWTKLVCYGSNGTVGFVDADDNRAFFRLRGTVVQENEERTFEVRNDSSVSTYGQRVLEMSGNFWLQDQFQTETMLSKLVTKTGSPIPVTDAIEVPGDPRVQIGDLIEVIDPKGMGASIKLQILGITRSFSVDEGLRDTYQVEVVEPVRVWKLGESTYSNLGQSTILG